MSVVFTMTLKSNTAESLSIVEINNSYILAHILYTYIIGHYKLSVEDYDLASLSTYFVCVNFLYMSDRQIFFCETSW